MAITSNGSAPYAPSSATIEIIRRFRDRGMETPFTTDVLERAGVSESLSQRTLQALKLLDFVDDDGNPTEEFHTLAAASSDEYPQLLAEMIQTAYEPIFRYVDPASDSPEQVEDAFRGCTPKGQRARMVTLFYGLCEEAQLITETPTRQSDSSTQSGNGRARSSTRSTKPDSGDAGSSAKLKKIQGLPSPLMGMIEALPESWDSREARDDWLALFTATLDYSIKVKEQETQIPEVSEQEVSA